MKSFCKFCGASTMDGICPFCSGKEFRQAEPELEEIKNILTEKASSEIGRFVAKHARFKG